MGKFRVPADRTQLTLLPLSVDEFVPPDDRVRYVDAVIEAMDLSKIEAAYSEIGRPGYAPKTLVKLLVYGRMRGERSARRLQRSTEENLRYIWLLGNERPDFRTICEFRRRFAKELGDLLKETIRVGCEEGVIGLEQVAVDGTVMRANAGSSSFGSRKQLEKRLRKLDLSFEADVEADAKEEDRDDDDPTAGPLPPHLRDPQQLREKIKAALDEDRKVKKQGRRLKQVSTTDPECRFIQSRHGRNPAYNAQSAVDVDSGMIVGAYVTNAVGDGRELAPMLSQIEENTQQNPKMVLADRGYNGYEAYRALEDRDIDGRIPPTQQRRDVFGPERFEYDESTDGYRCPDGKTLFRKGYDKKKHRRIYVCGECDGCSMATQCIGMSTHNRTLTISDDVSLKEAMAEKMNDEEVQASYRVRAGSIEPVFGHVKGNRGMRQFLFRGLERVSHDWRFEMAVTNIEKLIRLLDPRLPLRNTVA
jgi:transposase